MTFPVPRFQPHQPLRNFREIMNRCLAEGIAQRNIQLGEGLAGGPTADGIYLALDQGEQGFYARLSGSTSPYSFSEVEAAAAGAWSSPPSPRTGTANAYEFNAMAGLGGLVAWIRPDPFGAWRFYHVKRGTGTITVNVDARNCAGTLFGSTVNVPTVQIKLHASGTVVGSGTLYTNITVTGSPGSGYDVVVTAPGYQTITQAVTLGSGPNPISLGSMTPIVGRICAPGVGSCASWFSLPGTIDFAFTGCAQGVSDDGYFHNSSVTYQAIPAGLSALLIGDHTNAYLSYPTGFADPNTGDTFYYYLSCTADGTFSVAPVYITSFFGSPFLGNTIMVWNGLAGGQTYVPFNLAGGVPGSSMSEASPPCTGTLSG